MVATTRPVVVAVHACRRRQVRTNPAAVVHRRRVLDRWYTFSPHWDHTHLQRGTVAAVNASGSRVFPFPAHGRDRAWAGVVNIGVAADRRD